MKQSYVYRHIRLDTNTPFYIGKGSGNRAIKKAGRNRLWKNISEKYGYKIQYLKFFSDESEAYRFEEKIISLYKSFNLCEANLSSGGPKSSIGCSAWNKGISFSKEVRFKMSEAGKNRKPPTEETLIKRRASMLGKNVGKKSWITGLNHSSQTKYNIGKASLNRNKSNKPFYVSDANGTIIWQGVDRQECAKALLISVNSITKNLNNFSVTTKNKYICKFKEQE